MWNRLGDLSKLQQLGSQLGEAFEKAKGELEKNVDTVLGIDPNNKRASNPGAGAQTDASSPRHGTNLVFASS